MLLYDISIIVLATSCLAFGSSIPEIPPFLKICHRSDPHLNDCIKDSVNSLKPYLKDGIQALHIPPCEPLYLREIEINQTSGTIHVHAKYSNVSIYGGTDIVPNSIRYDLNNNRMKLKLHAPQLKMVANYMLDGKIMFLPIKGNGVGHGTFQNIDIVTTLQMERYNSQKTGQIHQRVTDVYMDFTIGHATMQLNNLFNGDTALSSAMNLFLNLNWRIIVAEIKPKLEEMIGTLIKNFSNNVFSVFPENVLLPP